MHGDRATGEAMAGLGQEAEAIALLDAGPQKSPNYVGLLRLRGDAIIAGDHQNAANVNACCGIAVDFRSRTTAYLRFHRPRCQREHDRVRTRVNSEAARQEPGSDERPLECGLRLELAKLCARSTGPNSPRCGARPILPRPAARPCAVVLVALLLAVALLALAAATDMSAY